MWHSWILAVLSASTLSNYLPNVLMKKEAVDAGVQYTISIDEDGFLGEGSTENIGIVTAGRTLKFPQFHRILNLTKAGAIIVSGSQAHQPQGIEIKDNSFIHHGLGNLFFDQIYEIPPNTATAFIDRHIFYNGKHINTELLTIKFIDFARARPMTEAEREVLLRKIFQASGW